MSPLGHSSESSPKHPPPRCPQEREAQVQQRTTGGSRDPTLDAKGSERSIHRPKERVVLRQEQHLPTPQNYFWSVHSPDPLRVSRSGQTSPGQSQALVRRFLFIDELNQPPSLWGKDGIIEDVFSICIVDKDDSSPQCQSHSTLQLPMCYECLHALSNPCWTLPVGCSLVHRGRVESTINLYPTKGKAMAMSAATTSLEWPD